VQVAHKNAAAVRVHRIKAKHFSNALKDTSVYVYRPHRSVSL